MSARAWRILHGWLTIAWATQFPLVYLVRQSLQTSIGYLVFISIASAFLGQMSNWQAARVEVKVDTQTANIENAEQVVVNEEDDHAPRSGAADPDHGAPQ